MFVFKVTEFEELIEYLYAFKKKCGNLCLKPQRRPIWKRKGDIPMAKISDEVTVNHSNRLQLKFEVCFSTVIY